MTPEPPPQPGADAPPLPRNDRSPQIEIHTVDLVCWRVWCDGPLDGLALWQGRPHWFAYLEVWNRGGTDWGYDYLLYELTLPELAAAVSWFQKKHVWWHDPARQARLDLPDSEERTRLLSEYGALLPDWPGPALTADCARAVAWFHCEGEAAWCADAREKFSLSVDFKAPETA